jgi:hypothetical protein
MPWRGGLHPLSSLYEFLRRSKFNGVLSNNATITTTHVKDVLGELISSTTPKHFMWRLRSKGE